MELNKDTWHYRNYNAWLRNSNTLRARSTRAGKRPVELCSYVRIALFWGFLRRFGDLIIEGMLLLVFIFMAGALSYLLGSGGFNISPAWLAILAGAGAVLGVLAVGLVLYSIGAFLWEKYEYATPRGKVGESNVVLSYARAKKRKICPIIEFREDEDA